LGGPRFRFGSQTSIILLLKEGEVCGRYRSRKDLAKGGEGGSGPLKRTVASFLKVEKRSGRGENFKTNQLGKSGGGNETSSNTAPSMTLRRRRKAHPSLRRVNRGKGDGSGMN